MKRMVRAAAVVTLVGVILCLAGQHGSYGQGRGPAERETQREPWRRPVEEGRGMDLRREQQLQLEGRRAEMEFEREMREVELQKARASLKRPYKGHKGKGAGCIGAFFLLMAVINVLLTIWVYQDVRARKTASGLWILIVLLGGIPAMIAYALVRLPEVRAGG